MSKRDSVKVYLNDEVVDLRGKICSTRPTSGNQQRKRFDKNYRSSTDLYQQKRNVDQKKVASKKDTDFSTQTSRLPYNNARPPTYMKRPLMRATSVDSRFRRLRTVTPEKSDNFSGHSATNLQSHYSASDPSFISYEKRKTKVCDFPPNDCSPSRTPKDKSVIVRKEELETSEREKLLELDSEQPILSPTPPLEPLLISGPSLKVFVEDARNTVVDYVTTVGEVDKAIKSSSTSDIIGVYDLKSDNPISQYWDDPRLLKKYNGLMRPVTQTKSLQSLEEYLDNDTIEMVPQRECWKCKRRKSNTYKFDDEETDCASSVKTKRTFLESGCSKRNETSLVLSLRRTQRKLFWLFYIIGSGLGIFIVAFFVWLILEKDIFRLFQTKACEQQTQGADMIQKTISFIFGPIVYIINRAIKTTATLLFLPVNT